MKCIKINNLVIITHSVPTTTLFKGVFCLFTIRKILPSPFNKSKFNSELHPANACKNIPQTTVFAHMSYPKTHFEPLIMLKLYSLLTRIYKYYKSNSLRTSNLIEVQFFLNKSKGTKLRSYSVKL